MKEVEQTNQIVLLTRIIQRLAGPAETIIGFQNLIVTALQRDGQTESLDDARTVLKAAQSLEEMINRLLSLEGQTTVSHTDDAILRHDLRTPINAILGYSELILEETAGQLDPTIETDIHTVVKECGRVLDQLDGLIDFSRGDIDTIGLDKADAEIAAALAHTLSHTSASSDSLGGRILVIDDIEANRE